MAITVTLVVPRIGDNPALFSVEAGDEIVETATRPVNAIKALGRLGINPVNAFATLKVARENQTTTVVVASAA